MDREEIRHRIEEEIEKVTRDIADLEELTRPISPENAIGRISRMDAINNKSVNEASLNQARARYSNLIRALDGIDKPEFGVCIKCKQNIPLGRIMLMPHTNKCVNCA